MSREHALADFLARRLPTAYRVGMGEVIDHQDSYSRQVDVLIFDASRNAAFRDDASLLIPAEAVLAIVEVKSILTRADLLSALENARSLRALRPFGENFVGARTEGKPAEAGTHRCFATVFAYESDLKAETWAREEWNRYNELLTAELTRDLIDRIVVLGRGAINPPFATARADPEGKRVLHEWFVGLVNFLARESQRRPAMDWQVYFDRYSPGWRKLEPNS
jgi:hypothetical protein